MRRIATVQARTKVKVRLRAHLLQMGVRLPTVKITALKGWAFLQQLTIDTPGTRGMALKSLLLRFEHLDEAVADWDAEIERLAEQFEAVQTLEKEAPGVGTILAATIAAEAWPLQRFRTPKAFARYTQGLCALHRPDAIGSKHQWTPDPRSHYARGKRLLALGARAGGDGMPQSSERPIGGGGQLDPCEAKAHGLQGQGACRRRAQVGRADLATIPPRRMLRPAAPVRFGSLETHTREPCRVARERTGIRKAASPAAH